MTEQLQRIHDKIRTIPDFPKPGIQFKDFTPLLANSGTLVLTSKLLAEPYKNQNVDFVAGLESRGFLFGLRLAQDLNAGFIPVRKPNKLPADTVSHKYELEYGTDTLEIHADAVDKGANVLIHDDLIATGGTAKACAELIEKLGGNIIGFSFIMQIDSLNGYKSLNESYLCSTLLSV
ncbi:adenine phosphoribosyltransferase [Rhodohalobacter sp. SW132]|uniref:adenine phosphoribosyltransferase n=1 Tax=Rhodohalobacter sp. SW132 TaxID=2293433 RepID=UPI000E25D3F8|nr:adenine phosphoribosyltransferase [Rhodohalobacter sp. SW132]REL38225.1 adenine phosphoribosyltransferase [Rhodohalobacter sp. SW132]